MQTTTSSAAPTRKTIPDDGYEDFLRFQSAEFMQRMETTKVLFTTDAPGLWETYLEHALDGARQERTCHACRAFVEHFGGLVEITKDGDLMPVAWPTAFPPAYAAATTVLRSRVSRARVTGVFLSPQAVWGRPYTGDWQHLALMPPREFVFASKVKTAEQVMAEKREEHGMLERSLAEFPIDVVRRAHGLLVAGQLPHSDKHIGVATWLLDLHDRRARMPSAWRRANITWLAAATAPAGFCHIRAGVLGGLLEDVGAGVPYAEIHRRHAAKLSPLTYQRPQATTDGNVEQAEKVLEAMGATRSLERRFAKLADIRPLWTPKPQPKEETPKKGVFGHLKAKATPPGPVETGAPPVIMTWAKFRATVLPSAEAIEAWIRPTNADYIALVTAQHAEAPPILQWDHAEHRNPVSWYREHEGSPPAAWNLSPSRWHKVTTITLSPNLWGPIEAEHHGAFVLFVLEGCRELGHKASGGFFGGLLRSEYHAVRATMEAYAKRATIAGLDEAEACGLGFDKSGSLPTGLRVLSRGVVTTYSLDRWD